MSFVENEIKCSTNEFIDAIQGKKGLEVIKKLFNKNQKNIKINSPMARAKEIFFVALGHDKAIQLIEFLFDNLGDDINYNVVNARRHTPLLAALKHPNATQLVPLILKQFHNQIDINYSLYNANALLLAVQHKDAVILIEMLSDAFGSIVNLINTHDSWSNTIIYFAIKHETDASNVVACLLERFGQQLDINHINCYNSTPLIAALEREDKALEIVPLLVNYYGNQLDINYNDYTDLPFFIAIQHPNAMKIVPILVNALRNTIDINFTSFPGEDNAIMVCLRHNKLDVAKYLIEVYYDKINFNYFNRIQENILILAMKLDGNSFERTMTLLDTKCGEKINFNEKNSHGEQLICVIIKEFPQFLPIILNKCSHNLNFNTTSSIVCEAIIGSSRQRRLDVSVFLDEFCKYHVPNPLFIILKSQMEPHQLRCHEPVKEVMSILLRAPHVDQPYHLELAIENYIDFLINQDD